MQLGHLLTHSGLTRLEVSLIFSPDFYCLWSVVFGIIINLLRGILFVFCKQFLPYCCILSQTGVVFSFLLSVCLVYNLSKCILLFFSYISSLLLLLFLRLLL